MIGKETRKVSRAYAHGATTLALFVFPYVYFSHLAQLLTGERKFTIEFLGAIIIFPCLVVGYVCGVKFMIISEGGRKSPPSMEEE